MKIDVIVESRRDPRTGATGIAWDIALDGKRAEQSRSMTTDHELHGYLEGIKAILKQAKPSDKVVIYSSSQAVLSALRMLSGSVRDITYSGGAPVNPMGRMAAWLRSWKGLGLMRSMLRPLDVSVCHLVSDNEHIQRVGEQARQARMETCQ